MNKALLDFLICPACLPDEIPVQARIRRSSGPDIREGELCCHRCGRGYPIESGLAILDPGQALAANKYETAPVLSSYLWSHYADLFHDEHASAAYQQWEELMLPHPGLAVDVGAAVGRFTFAMGAKSDFAVGVDTSRAFIRTARELMAKRTMTISLKQEGNITADVTLELPPQWDSSRVEFIVADALALPFRSGSAGSLSSLNLIDKVSSPFRHLAEMNRVARPTRAQLLLSDPFSWSEEAAAETEWLGGRTSGPFAGKGLDNIRQLLGGENMLLAPAWKITAQGQVWWKIRTHANHFEQIRSCYVKADR